MFREKSLPVTGRLFFNLKQQKIMNRNFLQRKIVNRGVNMDDSMNDKFYKINGALQTTHTIPVNIARYYTDVNGTIIDKALVPASLKVSYPVMLFGNFDRNGGWKKSFQRVPTVPGTFFLMTFTSGINQPFLAFTGANNIKGKIGLGDIVNIFTDDLENPTWFIWFIISSNTVSLASVISNTESMMDDKRIGVLNLFEINYYMPGTHAVTLEQFSQPLNFLNFDNVGNFRGDDIQPSMFLNPFVQQKGFLTISTPFQIDQYKALVFYMVFNVDSLQMDFIVKKCN